MGWGINKDKVGGGAAGRAGRAAVHANAPGDSPLLSGSSTPRGEEAEQRGSGQEDASLHEPAPAIGRELAA